MDELKSDHVDMVQEFKDKVAAGTGDSYMLTIARDGESPARSIYFYGDAIDAANGYQAYNDWGFAKDFLTVELYEPTGKVHSKVLRRPRGGECVFHREQYHQITDILLEIENQVEKQAWDYLTHELARLFSKDNQRFDEQRFLSALGNSDRGVSNDGPISY
jgi:hypothetical protein